MCNVSLKCVRTTLKNHELHNDVIDLPRLGRPLKLTSRDQSISIERLDKTLKFLTANLLKGSQIRLVTLVLADGLYEDA